MWYAVYSNIPLKLTKLIEYIRIAILDIENSANTTNDSRFRRISGVGSLKYQKEIK